MLYMDKGVCSECNVICYVFKLRLLYTVLDVSDVTTQLESQLSFSSFRGKPNHIASSSYANHQFNMLCHLVFYLCSNFLLLHSNHLPTQLTPQIHMIPINHPTVVTGINPIPPSGSLLRHGCVALIESHFF
jgi:hypothetical protein